MYLKSFLLVIFTIIVAGLVAASPTMVSAFPGMPGKPSSFDPKVRVEQAFETSEVPLLIEFYSDSCKTCQYVAPMLHDVHKKQFKGKLTLVMVDVTDASQSHVMQLFNIQAVPSLYVFDHHNMAKGEIDPSYFSSKESLTNGINRAIKTVQIKASAKRKGA